MFKKIFYGLMITGLAMSFVYGPAYAEAMIMATDDEHNDGHAHTEQEREETSQLDRDMQGIVEDSIAMPQSAEPPEETSQPQSNVRMRYNGDQTIMDGVTQPPRVFNNVR